MSELRTPVLTNHFHVNSLFRFIYHDVDLALKRRWHIFAVLLVCMSFYLIYVIELGHFLFVSFVNNLFANISAVQILWFSLKVRGFS